MKSSYLPLRNILNFEVTFRVRHIIHLRKTLRKTYAVITGEELIDTKCPSAALQFDQKAPNAPWLQAEGSRCLPAAAQEQGTHLLATPTGNVFYWHAYLKRVTPISWNWIFLSRPNVKYLPCTEHVPHKGYNLDRHEILTATLWSKDTKDVVTS